MFTLMNLVCQKQQGWARLVLALMMGFALQCRAADYLLWDKHNQKVDASVQKWDVVQVLQRIVASTRWQVFMQPGTRLVVPTRFHNLSEGEALRRLLGDLNFMQVPQSNGPPRLYVFRTTREEATELIPGLDVAAKSKAKPIEDELIVKLKPGESIEELARRLGAKVTGRLEGMNAYRLKFTDAEQARLGRESLLNDSSVAGVDYNYSIPQPQSAEAFGGPPAQLTLQPKVPPDGKYVIVGLIDTAIQPKEGQFGKFLMNSISVAGETTVPTDQPTHGTGMSETILNGMSAVLDKNASTSVRILPVDVYGNNVSTSTFDVALGITRAVEAGAKIINLSLGSDGDSTILHDVIASSHSQGVIFFAAAGNEPVTSATFPAAYPEATAVTAVDRTGAIASYANRGSFVEAGGPGTVRIIFGDQTYLISGTSASTAYVSGVAAATAEKTGKPWSEVEKIIRTLMPVGRP